MTALVWTGLVWTGLMFVGFPRFMGGGYTDPDIEAAAHHWWWIGLLAVGVLAMLAATVAPHGAAKERFGQGGVAFGLVVTAACLGILVGGIIHLRLLSTYLGSPPEGLESWELPDKALPHVFTLVAAGGAAVGLVWLPFAVARARRRQRHVLRDVEVRYDGAHSSRTVRAAMSTTSARVPLEGSRVVVFDDGAGGVLVEPDPDEPLFLRLGRRPLHPAQRRRFLSSTGCVSGVRVPGLVGPDAVAAKLTRWRSDRRCVKAQAARLTHICSTISVPSGSRWSGL